MPSLTKKKWNYCISDFSGKRFCVSTGIPPSTVGVDADYTRKKMKENLDKAMRMAAQLEGLANDRDPKN